MLRWTINYCGICTCSIRNYVYEIHTWIMSNMTTITLELWTSFTVLSCRSLPFRGFPFMNHCTSGGGTPSASHLMTASSSDEMFMFIGSRLVLKVGMAKVTQISYKYKCLANMLMINNVSCFCYITVRYYKLFPKYSFLPLFISNI